MAMPNPQENVVITDDQGITVFIAGRASVNLTSFPKIVVWGGEFLPDRADPKTGNFKASGYYLLQGNPSLGDRGIFWKTWTEADTPYYLFAVDNY